MVWLVGATTVTSHSFDNAATCWALKTPRTGSAALGNRLDTNNSLTLPAVATVLRSAGSSPRHCSVGGRPRALPCQGDWPARDQLRVVRWPRVMPPRRRVERLVP